MATYQYVALIAAFVVLVVYMMRRRGRINRED
jgi:hypothetical protein